MFSTKRCLNPLTTLTVSLLMLEHYVKEAIKMKYRAKNTMQLNRTGFMILGKSVDEFVAKSCKGGASIAKCDTAI